MVVIEKCSTSMVVAVDVTLVAAVAVAVVMVMLLKGWCVVVENGGNGSLGGDVLISKGNLQDIMVMN